MIKFLKALLKRWWESGKGCPPFFFHDWIEWADVKSGRKFETCTRCHQINEIFTGHNGGGNAFEWRRPLEEPEPCEHD